MKTGKSNKELLELIQKDDSIAFYNLYERYSKRLYGFVLRYLKQSEDTEEIVQEVFVKVWENRNKIATYSSLESFLFTIAYNATISLLRKRLTEKKYLDHVKSLQQLDYVSDAFGEIQFKELNERIQVLLNKLTPRQKEIYLLNREKGLSHEEIAKLLNISRNTVKKHMANTLAFLKSHIDTNLFINLFFIFLFL